MFAVDDVIPPVMMGMAASLMPTFSLLALLLALASAGAAAGAEQHCGTSTASFVARQAQQICGDAPVAAALAAARLAGGAGRARRLEHVIGAQPALCACATHGAVLSVGTQR